MDNFYLTTPIYYVNDVPHLGHAYTTIVGDVLTRYQRLRGRSAHYLTGTDEHGQKIERAALERGQTPLQLADEVVSRFKSTWGNLGIGHDDFIRTTDPRHKTVVQQLWQRIADRGDIYLGDYDGLYCVACEEYFTEMQLQDGRCPVHGTPVEQLKQPSYFFRMSRYQDALLEHFERHPEFVRPEIRRNEIINFVKGGLRDLSVSRTNFDWGIHVPGDDAHVIYVWIDALTNYISALGGFDQPAPQYQQFWPANVHLIGKDILRFHAVYWPCMLLSAQLPLPKSVFAHGWWTINGQKMSKTLANVVEPNQLAAEVGKDALRYFLCRETPLGSDGDFSHEGLIQRINADLANDLGNLLNRSLAMASKYCDGRVPLAADAAVVEPVDRDFVELAMRVRQEVAQHFEALAPSRALESLWELVRATNKYIDTTAPYKLARDPDKRPRIEQIVANFLEALRWIALMVTPVMPDKAQQALDQLGLTEGTEQAGHGTWPEKWGELAQGLTLTRGDALFPRIDDDRRAELMSKWNPQAAEPAPAAPAAPSGQTPPSDQEGDADTDGPTLISYDDFAKMDLRVARVVEAERVKGAKKLLRLMVDLGSERRQVVAGIAEVYEPESLVGKSVVLLANLEPATIRGVRSEGMILAAGEKKALTLTALDRETAPGAKVR